MTMKTWSFTAKDMNSNHRLSAIVVNDTTGRASLVTIGVDIAVDQLPFLSSLDTTRLLTLVILPPAGVLSAEQEQGFLDALKAIFQPLTTNDRELAYKETPGGTSE